MKVVYFRIIAYLCLTFTKQFMKRIIVSILLVSMCVMGPAAFAQANKLPVAQQGEVSIVNNTIWQPKHRHTLWYTEPAKVEKDLVKLLPPEISNHFCHQTVQFGRDICRARSPKCGECPLNYFCRDYAGNNKK